MLTRRSLIGASAGGVALGAMGAAEPALAAAAPAGRVSLLNLHTGERCDVVYRQAGRCLPDAMATVSQVLRDHRSGEAHEMDPALLDLLNALAGKMDFAGPFHVISGYRSPASNATLHAKSDGVATKSLHMVGKAIDIRAPGRRLTDLRDAALAMQAGGVGYYAASDFVHVDTGRVRRW